LVHRIISYYGAGIFIGPFYFMKLIYIYVKRSPLGLLYLGKTIKDPYKYKGSGSRWLNHIKFHNFTNKDIETWILHKTEDKEDLKKIGEYYSILFNIVESKEWANLKLESGDGGGSPWTQERRDLFIKMFSGDNHPNKSIKNREILKLSWTQERKDHVSKIIKGSKMSDVGKQKIKDSWTQERKDKMAKLIKDGKHGNFGKGQSGEKNGMFGKRGADHPSSKRIAENNPMFGRIGKLSARSRPISQYKLNGEFIKNWDSIADIRRYYKINNSHISSVCSNKRKSCYGYIWKYTKKEENSGDGLQGMGGMM